MVSIASKLFSETVELLFGTRKFRDGSKREMGRSFNLKSLQLNKVVNETVVCLMSWLGTEWKMKQTFNLNDSAWNRVGIGLCTLKNCY